MEKHKQMEKKDKPKAMLETKPTAYHESGYNRHMEGPVPAGLRFRRLQFTSLRSSQWFINHGGVIYVFLRGFDQDDGHDVFVSLFSHSVAGWDWRFLLVDLCLAGFWKPCIAFRDVIVVISGTS